MVNFLYKPLIAGHQTRQPAGAVLIVVIIAITLIAALGAALYSLSSSETYGNLSATLSVKAYYVSESGYRYAVGKYRGYDDMDDIIDQMEQIHDTEFSLPDNLGTFSVDNRPYFFVITDASDITAEMPGNVPDEFSLANNEEILIYIDNDSSPTGGDYYTATIKNENLPESIRFEIAGSVSVANDDVVYLAATVSPPGAVGDTLALDRDVSNFFPERDGEIEVSGTVYTYESLSTNGRELTGIDDLDTTISSGDYVLLRPMVQLNLTGETGGGETAGVFGRTREITYLTSLMDKDEILGSSSSGGGGTGGGGGPGGGSGFPGGGATGGTFPGGGGSGGTFPGGGGGGGGP